MSHRFTRTAVLNTGADLPKCIGWARELNSFLRSSYDIDVKFGIQQYAKGQVVWMTDFDDLAEFDEKMTRLQQDENYWKHIEPARGLFMSGSVQDTIVKIIE